MDPIQYITQLYQNVLGRAPDPAGLQANLEALQSGRVDMGTLAADFANSAEASQLVSSGQTTQQQLQSGAQSTAAQVGQGSEVLSSAGSAADMASAQGKNAAAPAVNPFKLTATAMPVTPSPQASSLNTYDPYSQYRGGAATSLNALVNNPSLALQSAGYQTQLNQGMKASEALAASTGQLRSGNELAALNTLGQSTFSNFYNNMFSQLSTLSGANQAPATAAAAQNAAQTASYLSPYQAGNLSAQAQQASTSANVAGYMAPYTSGQTQAQTNLLGAQAGYVSGAQTHLAESQAAAAQGQNALAQAQARASGAGMAGDIVGGVAGIISAIL